MQLWLLEWNEFMKEDEEIEDEEEDTEYAHTYDWKDYRMNVPKQVQGSISDFTTRHVPSRIGKAFIIDHHYAVGCHNGPITFGMFDANDDLIGVCAFNTPC